MEKIKDPQPIRQEQKDVKDRYEVLETGNVILTQTVITELEFTPQEFNTYKKGFEVAIANSEETMSEEYIATTKENIAKTQENMKKVLPIHEISQKNVKEYHENQMIKNSIIGLNEECKEKNPDMNKVFVVWQTACATDERKEAVFKELSDESKKLIAKIKIQQKQNKRK